MKTTFAFFFLALLVLAANAAEPAVAEASPVPTPTAEATPEPAPPIRLSQGDKVNLLNDAQLDQAVEILKKNFLNPDHLADRELKRARLEGLLARLGPGAEIVPDSPSVAAPVAHAFLAEVLDSRVGYVRIGSLNADELSQLDAVLAGLKEKNIKSLILDLRNVKYSSDFEATAEFARRFCPKGRLLFRVSKPSAKQERIFTSNQDPAFSGTLVVLTDDRTAGSAEVLAGALRQQANGMVIGTTTAGKPVEFERFSLGTGLSVQVAVAEATLPEAVPIFPDGLAPDISLTMPTGMLDEIFRLSQDQGVSAFVFEKERPRLNEAALIANLNPEIDGSSPANRREKDLPRDIVLQRAVDLVTAISFFNGSN